MLTPRTHPLAASFLDDVDAVREVLRAHGSPLNVLLPDVVAGNVAGLEAVLTGVPHRIWFAHKASGSAALVRAAVDAGVGVDVASVGEWDSALRAGATPSELLVTGPKGRDLLRTAVGAGAVVNVDNLWELAEVARLTPDVGPGASTRVLVRLSGFGSGKVGGGRVSRFGVPQTQWQDALDLLAGHRAVLDFLGPSFHVDSSELRDKVTAVAASLGFVERAVDAGLSPRVLDIGGGLRQVFLADPSGYERFLGALKRGALGLGPAMGWDGDLFGLRAEAGGVVGTPTLHKYGNAVPAPEVLRDLLEAPLPGHGGRRLGAVLADNLLELWVEPGKALVDQAGITLARVEFVTTASDGNSLVHVDLSRDKICPADQEVLVDPVLLPVADRTDHGTPSFSGFVAGNLCLERDIVCRHRVSLPRRPQPGDVLAFVNTAAYCMDLSAAQGLLHPRLRRVAIRPALGGFEVRDDAPIAAPIAAAPVDLSAPVDAVMVP